MEEVVMKLKLVGSLVLSLLVTLLGGADDALLLLVTLVVLDIVTGVIVAIIYKKLSSKAMTIGVVKKVMIFLVVVLACIMDRVFIGVVGKPLDVGGREVTFRILFIIYLCMEEGISLLENFGNIGVPYPKWLKEVLIQISDGVNNSTPTQVWLFINKFIGDNFIKESLLEKVGELAVEEPVPVEGCPEEVENSSEEEEC